MKLALISDTHGLYLPPIKDDVDVVIHAGDIGPDRGASTWLGPGGHFSEWCYTHNKPVFATWGNHDFIGQRLAKETINELLPDTVRIAVDELVEIRISGMGRGETLPIWFSPWSNLFGDWAFMEVESDLAKRYQNIPEYAEIIVSHGPPKGYGDRIYRDGRSQNVGSTSLLAAFSAHPNARFLVCGHIHEAAGRYEISPTKTVINCSQVNERYQPVYNAVQYIELF